jgi:hypothetical protein
MFRKAWVSAVLSVVLLGACEDKAAENKFSTPVSPPRPAASPEPVASPNPVPSPLDTVGKYALQSSIDVPASVLAAGPAADVLTLLQQLHDDPAAALFSALDQAGIPLVNDLYGVLPGALRDVVRGSINDYAKGRIRGDGGVGSELDQLLALANSTLTRFTLKSVLTIPAGAAAAKVAGAHTVDTVVFQIPGGPSVPVPPEILQKAMVFPGALQASPALSTAPASEGGDAGLSVGDHFFGLAYGEAIFSALDGAGSGEALRARLGPIFDCEGMGQYVSKRCISVLCIGHADDITEICSQGLDQVVSQVHAQLSTLTFQALRFESGAAWLWDAPAGSTVQDGLLSRLDHGAWKASIDVGTGPRECNATFTGGLS